MCTFSKEWHLEVASAGDNLKIGPVDSPHTGNRWFHRTKDNKPVCVLDKSKLLVRNIANTDSRRIKEGDVFEFRESRQNGFSNQIVGDFVYHSAAGLIKVGELPMSTEFEVVTGEFAANLSKAGNAVAELKAAPQPVLTGAPAD